MSQSHNPADTQGLLQSMLQRLRLQPGRDGQPILLSPVAASAWKPDGEGQASNSQKVNGSEFGSNGIPFKEFGTFAVDSNSVIKGGEIRLARDGCGMDKGLISFPSQKDNPDKDPAKSRVLGEATSPQITPTGTGQLFPAKSLKGADISVFEETDGQRVTFGSSAMTRHITGNKDAVTNSGKNQIQDHGKDQRFTPKVYMWSLMPTDANDDTGTQENKLLHVGNGGFEALAQSKDMQFVASRQSTTNSSSRRKQRPSENKTKRWTQKIKERWMDRTGSSGKKGKDDGGRVDQKNEQGTEISSQKQLPTAENLINTSNKGEERTLPSLDSSETPPTHTEESTMEERVRSSGDFEFGLGSFSLLEEIVTGQEWAKFLNPNRPAASANERVPEEPPSQLKSPPNPYDSGKSSLILNQQGAGNNQWSFMGTGSSPVSDFSTSQISHDASTPVTMEVSEGKQQQYVDRLADQSEPMEEWQPGESGQGQQRRPPSSVQPAHILENAALRRALFNRKRQHQAAERDERLHKETMAEGKEACRGVSISSLSITRSHVMEETGESQHDVVMPLHTLYSPPPPPSPCFKPFASAPRGVLKHSISVDSESSMETLTKRRRVEENRRVHFSEEVVSIDPPELDMDATDSEEDSGAEEDSVIEEECEVEHAEAEEVASARRPTLPAWIQALKRRNTGRKYR